MWKPHHPLREQAALDEALAAVKRTGALEFRVVPHALPRGLGDAVLEADAPTARVQFVAEIKTARAFATIGMVQERLIYLAPASTRCWSHRTLRGRWRSAVAISAPATFTVICFPSDR